MKNILLSLCLILGLGVSAVQQDIFVAKEIKSEKILKSNFVDPGVH